ncbi:hypothetical protein RP20_CCG019750 [Aedes albopictus]|nr:hypothetical protein RP20_CCG019750 [Aedes albopictus]
MGDDTAKGKQLLQTQQQHQLDKLEQTLTQESQCKPKKKSTIMDKFRYFKNNITVEPIVACYIMPSVLAGLATQNLNLEKACRVNLNYGDVVCDALTRRETSNYTT